MAKGEMTSEDRVRFDLFWEAYPRRRGKLDAEKAWRSLRPSNDGLLEICRGINRYMSSGEWRDQQFIPYPATFLRGQRWKDEVKPRLSWEDIPGGAPTRYCGMCGHTGTWHLREVKQGRNPGHEFMVIP